MQETTDHIPEATCDTRKHRKSTLATAEMENTENMEITLQKLHRDICTNVDNR